MEKNEWIKDYKRAIEEATSKQDKGFQEAKQFLEKDW
jgi:hypothetical protein